MCFLLASGHVVKAKKNWDTRLRFYFAKLVAERPSVGLLSSLLQDGALLGSLNTNLFDFHMN